MEDALNLLLIKGDCSLTTMPYNSSDSSTQPSQQAFSEAKLYRISSWSRINQYSVADIRGFLANNQPVLIGIKVFPSFDDLDASNPIYNNASGSSRGDHAMILIGYDDSKRALKFLNCWGRAWGVDGYGWIAYDLVPDVVVVGYVATDAAR
jgi:C1A family cysteine protease